MWMKTGPVWVLVLLLGAFSRVVSAQTVAVNGEVTDPQGGVVIGAAATLTASGGTRPVTTKTDAEGTFTFSVPAGRYTLEIDSPGFIPWTQTKDVEMGMPRVSVVLQIAGVLEDVQVSGSAPYNLTKPIPTASRLGLAPLETPASVAVVSGDLVRALGTTS